jgi:hypothetical protein
MNRHAAQNVIARVMMDNPKLTVSAEAAKALHDEICKALEDAEYVLEHHSISEQHEIGKPSRHFIDGREVPYSKWRTLARRAGRFN